MIERRFETDVCELDTSKIKTYEHDTFGPVTVFKDVVIARAIVHEYDDGWAYKPGKELGEGYWTASGMWATSGGHPTTAIISTRDEIHGRTINVRFSKSLKNVKTSRPMDRGILADLEVFDNKIPPKLLGDMKSGKKSNVSIGFFFDYDATAGVVDDEEDQALKGTAYDYVQRNITINHVAFGLDSGRCPMPYCGIGADGVIREVAGDPFAGYPSFEACIKAIMKENPKYTRKQAAGTCAVIEQRSKAKKKKKDAGPRTEAERAMAHFNLSEEEWEALSKKEKAKKIAGLPARGTKEKDFISTSGDTLSMKATIEEAKIYLKDVLGKLDSIEFVKDDLVEEEYQGNVTNITTSERAKRFHNISDDDWVALTEEEKNDYISKLPPEKVVGGKTNKDEADVVADCPDCEDDEEEIKRLATDLSLEDIDKKLKELKTARERLREQVRVLDEKLYQEPDTEKKRKAKIREERGELWDRLDDLYDEIRAYTQAKTLKITQSALVDTDDEGETNELDENDSSGTEIEKDAKNTGQVLKDADRIWSDYELIVR